MERGFNKESGGGTCRIEVLRHIPKERLSRRPGLNGYGAKGEALRTPWDVVRRANEGSAFMFKLQRGCPPFGNRSPCEYHVGPSCGIGENV